MARSGNPNPSPATRWKKGQSGNPTLGSRRKPISDAIVAAFDKTTIGKMEMPDGRTVLETILESIVRNIMRGNAKTLSDLWERVEGKAAEEPAAAADHPFFKLMEGFVANDANGASSNTKPKRGAKGKAKGGGKPKAKGSDRPQGKGLGDQAGG